MAALVAEVRAALAAEPSPAARPVGPVGPGDALVVTSVAHDSRQVEPGALFCCVRGGTTDGHDHAAAAVAAGAVALLVERPVDLAVPQVRVGDVRRAMGPAAAVVHGRPSASLDVVGVTGTNGKTTTTAMVAAVLEAAGRRTAVLGTLTGARTTPEAPDLQAWLAGQRDTGTEAVAMEVSSHGVALHRIDGTRFRVAVFTNLSRDHLDFHGTMEAYFAAKAALFRPEHVDRAAVNVDDPWGARLAGQATVPVVGFGWADADGVEVAADRARFRWRGQAFDLPMGGRFNVLNALAALTATGLLGVAPADAAVGLAGLRPVPGRFQAVDLGQPFAVLVDYAHTPDALEHLLASVAEVAGSGRIHLVFGCGGERDATKRAPMGEVAARGADRVVLTADNSRGEDTGAIITDVRRGIERAVTRPGARARDVVVEVDRAAAIDLAVGGAGPGDVVVLAGKGHEATQEVGGVVVPFDDREVAAAAIRRHRAGGGEDGRT